MLGPWIKLEVVKQEMARVNNDILGISKLKWTGVDEFYSDNYNSFKRTYAACPWLPGLLYSLFLTPWQATANHASVKDSWALTGKSGSVSCGVTAPFSWVLVCTRFCLCPPRVCFPSPEAVLLSNPTGLQNQIPWRFSVPLPDPQVGKSIVGPKTFVTVWELLGKLSFSNVQNVSTGYNYIWYSVRIPRVYSFG